jgi:type VI secretion system protein ImpL
VWDGLIADVTVPPLRGSAQATEIIALVSGPNSSLRLLWRGIAEETKLSQPLAGAATSDGAKAQPGAASAPAVSTQSRISAVLAPAATAAQPVYGQPVEVHFREFQEFVGGTGGGPAPIDEVLGDLANLYQKLNAAPVSGAAPGAGSVGELIAAARKLDAGAARMPGPIAGIARKIAREVPGASFGGVKAQIDNDWKEKVLKLCVQALDGRYPLQRTAQADVTPDDFAKLFAPNGLIDGFFNSELRQFVDTSHTPWRSQNADFPIAPEALQQFQLAAKIRDSFFAAGSNPTVRFEITPLSIDSDAKKAVLTVDGQEVPYEGGLARPMVVQWPGPGNVRQSEIAIEGVDGQKATLQRGGAWSLFRLLDRG